MVDTQPSLPLHFADSPFPEPTQHLNWSRRSVKDISYWDCRSSSGLSNRWGSKPQRVDLQTSSIVPAQLAEPSKNDHFRSSERMSGMPSTINTSIPSHYAKNPCNPSTHHSKTYSLMSNSAYLDPTHLRHEQSSQPASRSSSRPASPVFHHSHSSSSARTLTGSVIVPYLQLPSTISNTKGSLAEFAAQITCLFWFETSTTLSHIENSDLSPLLTTRLVAEAYPATGFMKWVTTILSTTQVTQNVILLALLFIHRLKKQCPNVKGKLGSEYRLLTVALMLGNKFLDDNTYTNKTWAEVSGISVHEIHVMEVEFLSHMKYNLYTSKEHWDQWHQQLNKFWTFFDRAARKQREAPLKQLDTRRPSLQIPYALPSPPASTNASPPYVTSVSPTSPHYSNGSALPPHLAPLIPSPAASMSEYGTHTNGRKRSYDGSIQEPPAKRQSVHGPYPPVSAFVGYGQSSHTGTPPSLPSLPMPNLPMPMSNLQHQYGQPRAYMAPQTPNSGGRSTPPTYLPPLNWLAGMPPSSFPVAPSQLYLHAENQGDRPSRHPTPLATPITKRTSPASTLASTAAHTIPPNPHSPSHFLTQRSSPYRPVRNISTLLVPPPSQSMQQFPSNITHDQMRWQPLGKHVDERTGRVPYLHREAWPQTHQFNQWPLYNAN